MNLTFERLAGTAVATEARGRRGFRWMSLFRGAWASTFFTSTAVLLLGVITGVMSARMLHADGRGALAAILLWPGVIAGVLPFGISEALTQRISSDRRDQQAALSTALFLCTVVAAASAAAACGILPYVLGREGRQVHTLAALYAVSFIPTNALALVLYAFEHGRLRFWQYNLCRLIVPLVYAVLLALLWVAGSARLDAIVAANLFASAVGLAIPAYYLRGAIRLNLSWNEARRLLSPAWQFGLTAFLLAVSTQADRMLLVKFWDHRSVGLYAVALAAGSTASGALAFVIHTVTFPNMAVRSDPVQQRQYLARILRHTVFLSVLCAAGIALLSGWFVPFAFGKEFSDAAALAVILAFAQIPFALRQVAVRALRGIGDGPPGMFAEGIAGCAFFAFAPAFGSMFDLRGIALAVCAGNAVSLWYLSVYLRRKLFLPVREWIGLDRRTATEIWFSCRGILSKA